MKKSNKLRVAVTGANGFVAQHTRNLLNKKGVKLYGIARRNFQSYKSESKIISPVTSISDISNRLKNCDALIHLIGTGRESIGNSYKSVNLNLTKTVIEICKRSKIKKIVYISGLGVSNNSISSYFISKYKAEQEIINSGLDYTIFRPSYIIGKNDPLAKNLTNQIQLGKITIPGKGNYHLQPIFVGDVAEIIFQAITSKKFSNKIIDLVGPQKVTFSEFVKLFLGKRKTKIKNVPLEQAYREALDNPFSYYGIDDLNIMVGDYTGNHNKLKKLSCLKFKKFRDVLQTSSLS
ncbi:MAG: NAD-dependent epimerase/dehydratase family protein [Nitrosopumilaceae archaeon]